MDKLSKICEAPVIELFKRNKDCREVDLKSVMAKVA